MRIVDQSIPADGHLGVPGELVVRGGAVSSREFDLQVEHVVRVYVNGAPAMQLTCSPDHVVELVVGRLYSEGFVSGVDDIEEVSLCEHASRAMVWLHDREVRVSRAAVDEVGTCCTDNRNLGSLFLQDRELAPVAPIAWSAEDVFSLAAVFESDTPMHRRTYGAHSCYLARGAEVLYCCEDLGRHNALDKVIGCALVDGVDLRECTVFTSGRVPTDMCVKAIRAGIPLLVSKAVPTDLAVQMAHEHGLTLVCSAHADSFRVM